MKNNHVIKNMDIKEFRTTGFLQELNRRFLHPIGMTLTVEIDDVGNESLGDILYTDNMSGIIYGSDDIQMKYNRMQNVRNVERLMHKERLKTLGYVVEPIAYDSTDL